MKKRFSPVLGAVHDDPVVIAHIAIREAEAARTNLDLRQAANKGWLAMSSIADVIASRMPGGKVPQDAHQARKVLADFERKGTEKAALSHCSVWPPWPPWFSCGPAVLLELQETKYRADRVKDWGK